ncbi:MAG TPA: tetraacyldisaccharide 4'-kinase, partial [Methylophilaceae bacterium]|nr:tetraacyldisaccharide 4'-kinase [Methylophilaceae bacterium]
MYYSKSSASLFLLPLSAIFFLISLIRKYLYRFNFLKSFKFKVPVVIVGNITLGG